MTEPQPPDYVIRSTSNPTGVHQGLRKRDQMTMLSEEQMTLFNQWNQNIANKDALASGEVPVLGTMATGTVNAKTVGIGPPTSVAVSTENMLVSQNFTSPDTVVTQNHWSWDGEDGNITLGCARVDCDGTQDDLVSNEIPVLVGESIEVSCQVKWENITYTNNNPIVLGVERYRLGRDPDTGGVTYLDLGGVDIASITAPAASGGWGTDGDLAGIYVVEPGVDQLRFRFRATTALIQGAVKWDEAVFLKLDMIGDAAVPGVGTTVDDIVINLFGADGESFTHNESALALANTSSAITSINARLAAIEAEGSTGAIAGDDFSWAGEITADANWGGGYLKSSGGSPCGSYTANGADAEWHKLNTMAGLTTQRCWFDWQGTGTVSTTDYQLIQVLLSSGPATGPATFKSYIFILGRISTDFSSYVRAYFGSDGTYSVGYTTNSGASFTAMNSGTCVVPGSGSLLSLYCGDILTTAPRHFKLKLGQSVIADFNESGSGSSMGAGNRKWGWGASAVGGYYLGAFFVGSFGQATPPKVNQWLGYDQ